MGTESAIAGGSDVQNFPLPVAGPQPDGPSQGAWITFEESGYYEGRYLPDEGDKVHVVGFDRSRSYAAVVVDHNDNGIHIDQCGWMMTVAVPRSALKSKKPKHFLDKEKERCLEDLPLFRNRYSFGKGFNCLPHQCVDGTVATNLAPVCDYKTYYNYLPFGGSKLIRRERAHTDDGFYDYAGQLNPADIVHYRFTTLDSQAAVVRTGSYNWIYMQRSCVDGDLQGGVLKPAKTLSLTAPLSTTVQLTYSSAMAEIAQPSLSPNSNQETTGIVRKLGAEQVFAKDGVDFTGQIG